MSEAEGNPSRKRTLPQILELAVRGFLDDVRVSLPGRVEAYDHKTQRADISPLVADRHKDEGGELVPTHIALVSDIPVAFKSAGGYSETFPIEVGSTGLLVVCSSSIARWKTLGGNVDPGDDRHHVLADAVFYPGLRDGKHALASVPTDAWCITVPSGKRILLGGPDADDPVMRKSDAIAFMTALATAMTALAGTPIPLAALTALNSALQAAIAPSGLPWITGMNSPVKVK